MDLQLELLRRINVGHSWQLELEHHLLLFVTLDVELVIHLVRNALCDGTDRISPGNFVVHCDHNFSLVLTNFLWIEAEWNLCLPIRSDLDLWLLEHELEYLLVLLSFGLQFDGDIDRVLERILERNCICTFLVQLA